MKKEVPLDLGRHLANRLFPLAIVVGVLIGLGLPMTYYTIESRGLRQIATMHAQDLTERFQGLVLESPALWKYQTDKYLQILRDFLPLKDVMIIRVLDETGRSIAGHEYVTVRAEA